MAIVNRVQIDLDLDDHSHLITPNSTLALL